MGNHKELETLFGKHGFTDFRWIEPKDIVAAHWVRQKCTFGCPTYGKNATCPPNVPSVAECRAFFDEYALGAVFHFEKAFEEPGDRHAWSREVNRSLLAMERDVFLAGNEKAFLLFMDPCGFCSDCTGERDECKHPKSARPSPESMAVDVFATVRQVGYPIQVLTDYSQAMNRYAILLVQ